MSYNITDIVEKAIKIEEKRIFLINELINENKNLPTINLLGKVFEKESRKMIDYYKTIELELNNSKLEEIDFRTYDKISFLINEFFSIMFIPVVEKPKEYMNYALQLSSNQLALFLDIQGRLVNNSNRADGITYNVLSDIIVKLEQRVDSIKRVL